MDPDLVGQDEAVEGDEGVGQVDLGTDEEDAPEAGRREGVDAGDGPGDGEGPVDRVGLAGDRQVGDGDGGGLEGSGALHDVNVQHGGRFVNPKREEIPEEMAGQTDPTGVP